MDIISYLLYEQDELVHTQLLDTFVHHGLLLYQEEYYIVNVQKIVTGIFLPLTHCYSPTCHPTNSQCYSSLCPNKQFTINQLIDQEHIQQKEWISSIPRCIIDSVSRKELKRQAAISELLLTEQHYIQGLVILHTVYGTPLLNSHVIPEPQRRQEFYQRVFRNYLEITQLHHSFYNTLLSKKRRSAPLLGRIGSALLQHVTRLMEPYIIYTSSHIRALHTVSTEVKHNLHFAKFLEKQDIVKFTGRLGFHHYLIAPTQWIGKFKLMVEAILKHTEDDGDELALNVSLSLMHDILCCMNNKMQEKHIIQLDFRLYPSNSVLQLPTNTKLLLEQDVRLISPKNPLQWFNCHLFLFSHALILTYSKVTREKASYIVVPGFPIPVQMISIRSDTSLSLIRRISQSGFVNGIRRHRSVDLVKGNSQFLGPVHQQIKTKLSSIKARRFPTTSTIVPAAFTETTTVSRRKPTYVSSVSFTQTKGNASTFNHSVDISMKRRTLTISHLANPQYTFKLKFSYQAQKANWQARIQQAVTDSTQYVPFRPVKLELEKHFMHSLLCACGFSYLNQSFIVFGTSSGVYMMPIEGTKVRCVISGKNAKQLGVFGDELIVLMSDILLAYRLEVIVKAYECISDPLDYAVIKQSCVVCFEIGTVHKQSAIVFASGSPGQEVKLSTTILISCAKYRFKKLEKIGLKQIDGGMLFDGESTGVVVFEKKKYIYDGQNVDIFPLFSHASLKRIKFDCVIHQLVVCYPFLIAFCSSVIEIRHIETGDVVQAIPGDNIQYISSTSRFVLFNMSPSKEVIQLYRLQKNTL
ncbi:RHO1 GDP-GTP exchange protein 2 [Rhizopus azygosporus]|uniref:RHO1 GDP-GTP exchange protein 2 n=1 Tax=Rhizopus azygosporus TaxID=86630 RepID=A0A367KC20_RHIAZ|nr:RHO1 GDP-GTP exchange protein 2 [Rhizopus azygosporus]